MENSKALEDEMAKFEDWYKAIIFDLNCNVIAKKNCDKLKNGELKEFLTSFDDRYNNWKRIYILRISF